MSITSLGLGGLEKASIPTSSRFSSPVLPQLNSRFPAMDARLVAAARLPGLSVYGSPYTSPSFPGYLPYTPAAAAVAAATADPSSFYPPLGPGENADSWRASLTQAAAAAYYDPAIAAHYGYGYGPMSLSDGARRKNATRETTSTLKAWLNEHRKNPYPTKGEKIMLAIITKMTLTQVSTWFANARRRLKKENKMTWSPRNRCGEDDDDDDLADDGPLNGENQSSRLSTPISPDLPPNGRISSHPLDRSQFNGHSSGIDSNSDEGLNYNNIGAEVSRSILKNEPVHKSERKSPPVAGLHPINFEEAQARLSSSHFSRQHSHPYDSSSSSPPLTSLGSNLSNSSSIARPTIPFPQHIPQLSVVPSHPNMLHPGLTEQLSQSASLNRLPPHLMAALIEQAHQFHYHPAIQGLSVNSFLNTTPGAPKTSSSSTTIESDALKSPSFSGSVSSTSPSTPKPSSPTKSKIWSIADVAASSDSSKTSSKPKLDESLEHSSNKTNPNEMPNMKMWMDVWQLKIAASMAGNMNPQQIPQLTNPHTPLMPQNRFPPFQGFPGLIGIPENAKSTLKDTEITSQDMGGRSSLSPHHSSPEMKDCNTSNKITSNNCRSSPGSSYHGDSSVENSDAK